MNEFGLDPTRQQRIESWVLLIESDASLTVPLRSTMYITAPTRIDDKHNAQTMVLEWSTNIYYKNVSYKKTNSIPLITVEYHSVSMIFQQDSVVLSTVI